jgi:hypothetical protein
MSEMDEGLSIRRNHWIDRTAGKWSPDFPRNVPGARYAAAPTQQGHAPPLHERHLH